MTTLRLFEPEPRGFDMGMSNSDDEAAIRKEHDLMEKIKRVHPNYGENTRNMNEDHRAIYDEQLKEKFKELFEDPWDVWANDRR